MARKTYTSRRGEQTAAPTVDFELDGEVFTGQGSISMMDISEFARLASQGVDSESPEAIAFLADLYLSVLGEKEYQRFRAHCRKHGTGADVLLDIIGDLAAQVADRPTPGSSDSSAGPSTAPATAKVVSFKQGTVETKPVEEKPKVVSYG